VPLRFLSNNFFIPLKQIENPAAAPATETIEIEKHQQSEVDTFEKILQQIQTDFRHFVCSNSKLDSAEPDYIECMKVCIRKQEKERDQFSYNSASI